MRKGGDSEARNTAQRFSSKSKKGASGALWEASKTPEKTLKANVIERPSSTQQEGPGFSTQARGGGHAP